MSSNIAFLGSVPANYEQYLGPFLFEPYAKDLIKRLPNNLYNVLEIACGTGRVTNHLLSTLAQDGSLTATDLNPDMISIARQKVSDSRITWETANAQELPFADDNFDAVVCQYGVMFFPDKAKAFSEAHRVLKEGGKFIFNAWNSVASNPPTAVVDRCMKEEFGGENAPKFFENAPYSFYDPEEMKKLMNDAGFKNISVELVTLYNSYSDPDIIIKGFLDGTPLASYLAEQDPAQTEKVRKKIREELISEFGETSDKVRLEAWVVEGVR